MHIHASTQLKVNIVYKPISCDKPFVMLPVVGEEPCDAADACCKLHDECVGSKSVLEATCHTEFIHCLDQVLLAESTGFSKKV